MAHRKSTNGRDTTRTVGFEAPGSAGDIRDRFRGTYRPGTGPTPAPLGNPFEQVGQWWGKLQEALKKRAKPRSRVSR